MNTFMTIIPKKPNTIEGIPASISIVNFNAFLSLGGAISAINIAVAKPIGTAIIIEPNETKKVPIIIGNAPNCSELGNQLVVNRNSYNDTSRKKEPP
jgi:hypothetical protein